MFQQRALGTGSSSGGDAIDQSTIFPELIEALGNGDPVRRAGARIVPTPDGAPMSIPSMNDQGE